MKIPLEIQSAMKNPAVKKAWISEYIGKSGACQNCGGTGIVAAFIATDGPFDSPANPYSVRDGHHLASKAETINGITKWWVGQTYSMPCPECANSRPERAVTPQAPVYKQRTYDASGQVDRLTNRWAKDDRDEIRTQERRAAMDRGE
jgi:hypothetical protein